MPSSRGRSFSASFAVDDASRAIAASERVAAVGACALGLGLLGRAACGDPGVLPRLPKCAAADAIPEKLKRRIRYCDTCHPVPKSK